MLPSSKFRPVSFGQAAENLTLGSRILEVTPVEWLPYLDGEITSDFSTLKDEGVDGAGNHYNVEGMTTNTVKAEWLPMDSNRATPPNIRRGEGVQLYQFANSDKFYWTDLGLHTGLRRRETVVHAYSNTTDEKVTRLTPENSWSSEVSTHTKQATFRTNKSDGEKFAYTVQINAKDGRVTVTDDDGNYFFLDSEERMLTLTNKDGSYVTLDKRDILVNAPDLIKMTTTAIQAFCKTFLLEAKDSITMKTKVSTLNASESINMQTTNLNVQAATALFDVPDTTFTGMVTVLNLLTAAGGLAAIPGGGSGSASISVPMTVNAAVETNGTLKNNGVNVGSTHQHNETGLGGGTTTPPL